MDAASPAAADRVDAIVVFFEQLTRDSLFALDRVYAPAARFKDPFNDVTGLSGIHGVYAHMFDSLREPRFAVTQRIVDGDQCFLVWDFTFGFQGKGAPGLQTVRGASHLVLGPDGRITLHRDYWDAAEELYEKLPVLGSLMRWLKRRVNRPRGAAG